MTETELTEMSAVRYAVLFWGILGLIAAGIAGYLAATSRQESREHIEAFNKKFDAALNDPKERERMQESPAYLKVWLGLDLDKYNEEVPKFYAQQRALLVFFSGVLLAFLGVVVSFIGRGFSGAGMLLVAGAGPGILNPALLIFSGSFILAGLCSLFVRPPRQYRWKRREPVDD